MNKKNSIWLLVAVWTLVSCGTVKSTREKPAVALAQSSLTPEQQRKYDYFFLEAMRLKEKKDYASAFGLLQHCLDIHPNAASALYEVSQYYMFLRQVPQGINLMECASSVPIVIKGASCAARITAPSFPANAAPFCTA